MGCLKVCLLGFIFWLMGALKGFALPPLRTELQEYKVISQVVYDDKNRLRIALRSYKQDNISYLLIVDPSTFKTKIIRKKRTKAYSGKLLSGKRRVLLSSTPYMKALSHYTAPPYPLQNYGVTSALNSLPGSFLTIDMCPSRKRFEELLFKRLLALSQSRKASVPFALCMSGVWMLKHPEEFNWIKKHFFSGKFDITWVNHSFHHPYERGVPLERNFLLKDEKEFEKEVLNTEKLLVENGLTPSVFFRFPGLVSNENLVKKLRKMGLIPLGSNTWLAKGERIQLGSIILVHGNGNEPQGIKALLPLLPRLNLRSLEEAFGSF